MNTASNVVPIIDYARRKETLIKEALDGLREAYDTDEQLGEVEDWSDYYDRNLANVTDAKIIAGHIEVQMLKRRGERLPPREPGGGDKRSNHRYQPGNTDRKPAAQRKSEAEARVVAEEPEAVNEYLKEQTAAGKSPSKIGAIEKARTARKSKSPSKSKREYRSSRVPKSKDGIREQLQRLRAWFKDLRTKIENERRANKEQRDKKVWNTDDTSKVEQRRLLDFIQDELDKVPELFSVMK